MATIDVAQIDMSNLFVSWWVHERQKAMGWQESERVPLGFYLFLNGSIGGFHRGLIDIRRDTGSITAGVFFGLIGFIAESPKAVSGAWDLGSTQAAGRVVASFEESTRRWRAAKTRAKARVLWEQFFRAQSEEKKREDDEALSQALGILGLSSQVTYEETKRAKKALAAECHPDKFHSDPKRHRLAIEQMTQINTAFDLIVEKKGWK